MSAAKLWDKWANRFYANHRVALHARRMDNSQRWCLLTPDEADPRPGDRAPFAATKFRAFARSAARAAGHADSPLAWCDWLDDLSEYLRAQTATWMPEIPDVYHASGRYCDDLAKAAFKSELVTAARLTVESVMPGAVRRDPAFWSESARRVRALLHDMPEAALLGASRMICTDETGDFHFKCRTPERDLVILARFKAQARLIAAGLGYAPNNHMGEPYDIPADVDHVLAAVFGYMLCSGTLRTVTGESTAKGGGTRLAWAFEAEDLHEHLAQFCEYLEAETLARQSFTRTAPEAIDLPSAADSTATPTTSTPPALLAAPSTGNEPNCLFPKRAAWLRAEMKRRGITTAHGLASLGGPNNKTCRKILDGHPVRADEVLPKIVDALNVKRGFPTVTREQIPDS
jgi:hypothetical protein